MNKHHLKITAAAVALTAWTCAAYAGLDGSTVDVSAYYPNTSSLYEDGGDVTVNGGVEYPAGSFSAYNTAWQVQVTDDQMIISNPDGLGFPYSPASFNGWVLTVVSGPDILSATVDGSSQFDPVSISIVGGDQLFLNYSGVDAEGAESSIIDITTGSASAPDGGSTIALLGAAITGLGLIRRKI